MCCTRTTTWTRSGVHVPPPAAHDTIDAFYATGVLTAHHGMVARELAMAQVQGFHFDHSVVITAAPTQVLAAFFDPHALTVWWGAVRSVTTPRPLGIYAIEWETTPFQDDVLGTLGGVFHGTVMEFRNGREFFLADAYWLPPESDPIGPMALEVSCRIEGPATRLEVRQSGAEDSARWLRYYVLIASGWKDSLAALKHYLEHGAEPRLPSRGITRRM